MTTPVPPRPRVQRNPSIMNSEPINTNAAKTSLKAVREYFARSEPFLSKAGMYVTTTSKVDDYEDALDVLVHNVQMAKIDKDRTNEAKWRAIDALTLAWEGPAVALIASVEAQVAEWDRKLHAAATPPAPIADRATLEAALANARADARMVLDAATDRDREVPHRLAELVRGDDPVLAYLVLATSWPATYMRAFDLKTAPVVWQHERGKLLGGVLTDAALAAYERLPGLPDARKAATLFRGANSFLIRQNPDYFPRPDGA